MTLKLIISDLIPSSISPYHGILVIGKGLTNMEITLRIWVAEQLIALRNAISPSSVKVVE
jgi:hypothetical protein